MRLDFEAGCRKQGQGPRIQNQLQTQPMRREVTRAVLVRTSLYFLWTREMSSVAARVQVTILSPLLAKHVQNAWM